MGTIKGNNVTLVYKAEPTNGLADITSTSSYNSLTGITSASISIQNATYETNFKDVTAATGSAAPVLTATRAYSVGTTTTTLSIEGVYDPGQTYNADELFALCKAKTRIGVFWKNSTGTTKSVGGIGFCSNFELSAGTDDFATFSASFELSGDPKIIS